MKLFKVGDVLTQSMNLGHKGYPRGSIFDSGYFKILKVAKYHYYWKDLGWCGDSGKVNIKHCHEYWHKIPKLKARLFQ